MIYTNTLNGIRIWFINWLFASCHTCSIWLLLCWQFLSNQQKKGHPRYLKSKLTGWQISMAWVVPITLFGMLFHGCCHSATLNINKLLCEMFTKKNVLGDQLPPTLDALVFSSAQSELSNIYLEVSISVPVLNLKSPIGIGQ